MIFSYVFHIFSYGNLVFSYGNLVFSCGNTLIPSTSTADKIDLNNLFNGVHANQVKNSRRVKRIKVVLGKSMVVNGGESGGRPCLKNLTNSNHSDKQPCDEMSKKSSSLKFDQNTIHEPSANNKSSDTSLDFENHEGEEEVFVDFNRLYDLPNKVNN